MENSRKEPFLSFESHAVPRGVPKSPPARDVTHRHPGLVHSPPPLTQGPSRRSGRVSRHPRACSQAALTLLNNGPKHTSRDAGSPALPKRGRGELPLSAKARVCACVCVRRHTVSTGPRTVRGFRDPPATLECVFCR